MKQKASLDCNTHAKKGHDDRFWFGFVVFFFLMLHLRKTAEPSSSPGVLAAKGD